MEHTALKKLRKELGLSLANAALQVHVTPRTWARYEKGDRKIPEGIVHLFCNENNIEYPLKRGEAGPGLAWPGKARQGNLLHVNYFCHK